LHPKKGGTEKSVKKPKEPCSSTKKGEFVTQTCSGNNMVGYSDARFRTYRQEIKAGKASQPKKGKWIRSGQEDN